MIERIEADLKSALLAGEKQTVSTLKLIKSALINKKIDVGEDLNEEQIMQVLKTELKRREEAAEMYAKGDRPDSARNELAEAEIIKNYLPKQLTDDELAELISKVKTELGADANMGQIIQTVIAKAEGKTDGKKVSQALKG